RRAPRGGGARAAGARADADPPRRSRAGAVAGDGVVVGDAAARRATAGAGVARGGVVARVAHGGDDGGDDRCGAGPPARALVAAGAALAADRSLARLEPRAARER